MLKNVLPLLLLWSTVAGAEDIEKRINDPVFHGEVYYHVTGPANGPTVMLVHGLGDRASHDWDKLAADLSHDYRVVRFDLPGFGRSSKDNQAYTPDNYTQFLHALVDRESHARPFFLIGHSMGGAISLRYAARYPQDVRALVLVDVPAILHRSVYSKHMAAFGLSRAVPGLYPGENEGFGYLLDNILARVDRRPVPVELTVQIPKMREKILNGDPLKIAGLALALEDFSRDIPRVAAPTLLLWGERDEIAPMRNAKVLAANLPRARLETFPESGHVPMEDVPARFQARVRDFLRDPVVPGPPSLMRETGPLPESTRVGRCTDDHGQVFEGDYDRIEIKGCDAVILRRVHAKSVRVVASNVSIEDSRIGGGESGLIVEQLSRVTVTASRIEGRVAILADDSKLDIAGSRISGQDAAVSTRSTADAAFSVCQVDSPNHYGPLHGVRNIVPDMPL